MGQYTIRSTVWSTLVLLALLLAAEVASRIDDFAFQGVPLLSSPTYESELRYWDGSITRGKPNGHFKIWRLNEHGFRSPSHSREVNSKCVRVMLLGASELFGYVYESEGGEVAARLQESLSAHGCFEVINASIAGLSLRSARLYWHNWLSGFAPSIVVIYPNPLFFASPGAGTRNVGAPRATVSPSDIRFRSRFIERLKESLARPEWFTNMQMRRRVAELKALHGSQWELDYPPPENLERFRSDLESLIHAVDISGPKVVLLTHAVRVPAVTPDADPSNLLWLRRFVERVTEAGQLRFHNDANEGIRSMARERGLMLVDADATLSGCQECFGDMVHFTDVGSQRLASLLAPAIRHLAEP